MALSWMLEGEAQIHFSNKCHLWHTCWFTSCATQPVELAAPSYGAYVVDESLLDRVHTVEPPGESCGFFSGSNFKRGVREVPFTSPFRGTPAPAHISHTRRILIQLLVFFCGQTFDHVPFAMAGLCNGEPVPRGSTVGMLDRHGDGLLEVEGCWSCSLFP